MAEIGIGQRLCICGVTWRIAAVINDQKPWLWLVHEKRPDVQSRFPVAGLSQAELVDG